FLVVMPAGQQLENLPLERGQFNGGRPGRLFIFEIVGDFARHGHGHRRSTGVELFNSADEIRGRRGLQQIAAGASGYLLKLTPREQEVLALLAEGYLYKEIGEALGI